MPRGQNAHAYVNAGFLIELNKNNNTITKATVVYGGIRPSVSLFIISITLVL